MKLYRSRENKLIIYRFFQLKRNKQFNIFAITLFLTLIIVFLILEKHKPNLLLIAGTGRQSGKTTLVCSIINKFSKVSKVIGVKICPFFHDISEEEFVLVENDNYMIIEEKIVVTSKDSSRMLKSGAYKVFYLQVMDENLEDAFSNLLKFIEPNALIICESGGLRKYVKPGLFIVCNREGNKEYKQNTKYVKSLADEWSTFNGSEHDFNINRISVKDNEWIIENH